MKWKSNLAFLLILLVSGSYSYPERVYDESDEKVIRSIYDEALLYGQSYANLRELCKGIGHRLTGSEAAALAVEWGYKVLQNLNPDTLYYQTFEAPHWERGDIESARILHRTDDALSIPLEACALGGSVGTDGILTAELIEVRGIEDLEKLGKEKIEGKIVFFNRPMERSLINTFSAYGACVDQRYAGASNAAKYGALAVMVRSMTTKTDHDPHTGSMGYKDDVKKIPALAISTYSADKLHNELSKDRRLKVEMRMNCETLEPIQTANVIAELRGSKEPESLIVIGGHLDSWDKGEGAHDDGAGIVHSIELLRLLKTTGLKPKHTIRVVLFMNEENGNFGGRTYAERAKDSSENHIIAMESDRGGFTPRGFSIDGSEGQIAFIVQFRNLLEPYGLHFFEKGYAGVDIGPLKKSDNLVNPNLLMLGLYPDPQRYFDYHHSDEDVFETVNQRELELVAASMAFMMYLLDKYWELIKA